MDTRTEFVEKLSAQMVEWDVQIDRLKEKAESATPEEKFEYSKMISALQLKRDEAATKLQGISAASDDVWKISKRERNESGTRSGRSCATLSGRVNDAALLTKPTVCLC